MTLDFFYSIEFTTRTLPCDKLDLESWVLFFSVGKDDNG